MLKVSKKSVLLFIISIFILNLGLLSQNSNNAVLQIIKGKKVRSIKPGKKLKIWYAGKKHKGRLDSIGKNSIFINNTEYELHKIDKISLKPRGTQVSGSIVGTVGLAITTLGTVMITKSYNNAKHDVGGTLAVFILTGFGLVIGSVGILTTAAGASILFISKRYKKEKGWVYKIVPES